MTEVLHGGVVPIALFLCVTYGFTYAIKALLDARMRSLLARSGTSEELIRAIIQAEDLQRRRASLRWGIILVGLALAFGLIQAFGWNEITPGVVALLAGATGLGNLAFFVLAPRLIRND
jgi:hypothetical protein